VRSVAPALADARRAAIGIQLRQIGHFQKADPAYGSGADQWLGLGAKLRAAE
jgi:hypothetical protein